MKVLTRNMIPKLGSEQDSGFEDLGLDADLDDVLIEELTRIADQNTPCVVLWHSLAIDKYVRAFLQAIPSAFVLWVSTVTREVAPSDEAQFGNRLRSWSLPNLDGRRWNEQLEWKQRALKTFVSDAVRVDAVVPNWELLDPPRCPEHVLACYLCALGGVAPPIEWNPQFDVEVGYFRTSQALPVLSWHDRANVEELRAFLMAAQALHPLKQKPVEEVSDAIE